MQEQHSSSRFHRPSVHQGRRQILFVQRDRCSHPSSLYRVTAESGGPAGRPQPHEVLEGYGDAGFSPIGQCPGVSGQQPLPPVFWPGDQVVSALRHYPGIHPDQRAVAQWSDREFQ